MSTAIGDNSTPTNLAQSWISALNSKHPEDIRGFIHDARYVLIRKRGFMTLSVTTVLNTRIADERDIEDRLHDLEERIDGNGDFATVWASYERTLDGKPRHYGCINFCFWRKPVQGWMIVAMQDNARSVKEEDDGQGARDPIYGSTFYEWEKKEAPKWQGYTTETLF